MINRNDTFAPNKLCAITLEQLKELIVMLNKTKSIFQFFYDKNYSDRSFINNSIDVVWDQLTQFIGNIEGTKVILERLLEREEIKLQKLSNREADASCGLPLGACNEHPRNQ